MATTFALTEVTPVCSRNACGGYRVGSILVRSLDRKMIAHLKKRARLNGRLLRQEVKTLLERAAETLTMRAARRVSDQWKRGLGGRSFSDSVHLIREDRDSR